MPQAEWIQLDFHPRTNRKFVRLGPKLTIGHPTDEFHFMNHKSQSPRVLDRFVPVHAQLLEDFFQRASSVVDGVVVDVTVPQGCRRKVLKQGSGVVMVKPGIISSLQSREVGMTSIVWPRFVFENRNEIELASLLVYSQSRVVPVGPVFSKGYRTFCQE